MTPSTTHAHTSGPAAPAAATCALAAVLVEAALLDEAVDEVAALRRAATDAVDGAARACPPAPPMDADAVCD